jgi:hypothetical protein
MASNDLGVAARVAPGRFTGTAIAQPSAGLHRTPLFSHDPAVPAMRPSRGNGLFSTNLKRQVVPPRGVFKDLDAFQRDRLSLAVGISKHGAELRAVDNLPHDR